MQCYHWEPGAQLEFDVSITLWVETTHGCTSVAHHLATSLIPHSPPESIEPDSRIDSRNLVEPVDYDSILENITDIAIKIDSMRKLNLGFEHWNRFHITSAIGTWISIEPAEYEEALAMVKNCERSD
ncbi:hypothetical protein L2E82_21949 [Cichorium intybus]|uniref:Uncharacterized protein n=1 Tax=Cichorium intybus TaxID=13427 RepID=A0ACB9DX02_CICIN|nr:hypothetical protein L2E82_21949 [Cichorium intybus]